MATSEKIYTRLARNAFGVASYDSLWLAADHLLIVKSTGYTENYSRLLLRDIQAFFVIKTERRMWWSLSWGAIALISGIVAIVIYNNDETPVGSVIVFGLGLGFLLWNEILGPSVRVMVVTGVQTVPLPSLARRKKARRVLGRLQSLIESAQADLVVAPEAAPIPVPESAFAPEVLPPAATDQPATADARPATAETNPAPGTPEP